MLKLIRRQLLKSAYIRQAVADYRRRMKEEAYKEHWAGLMQAGQTIRREPKRWPVR